MRGLVGVARAVLLGAVVTGVAWPAAAKENREYTAGQWTGFSYTDDDDGHFTDCTVWAANRDDVQIGVSVRKDWSLQLWLYSKAWNLPQDKSYALGYWIDRNRQYGGTAVVVAKTNARIDVDEDNEVFQELKSGNELTVRTTSDDPVTYVFDLAGSRSALSQLVECVDHYAKVATTNPFGSGEAQGGGLGGGGQQQSSQQQDNGGGQQNDNSNEAALEKLTVSADDLQAFLIDVTGAKPSMISVSAQSDKSGGPYYTFDTPLGGGEFWQEKRTGGTLQDIALGYLDDYVANCKGASARNPSEPVSGDRGQLVAGTAYCEKSPYQKDSGPEFLSYSMVEADGVVSIYLTYTGGNAAKAKSDSLGRLIAKRSEALLKRD
jgi:hypothetical protein